MSGFCLNWLFLRLSFRARVGTIQSVPSDTRSAWQGIKRFEGKIKQILSVKKSKEGENLYLEYWLSLSLDGLNVH